MRLRSAFAWTPIAVLMGSGALVPAAYAQTPPCDGLATLTLAGAKVTSAQVVAAGAFTPPANMAPWLSGDPSLYKKLPAFCRVMAVARPSADSDIKIEVWMPARGWNGNFRGQGNGGFAGEIDYRGLAAAVGLGYASAGTDTGHAAAGTDAKWALGHPEKVIDYGYRAIHEMTLAGKGAVKAFYGNEPRRSYFAGCSNGGRQALMEAQRFPGDYDGILAGAPANYWTHLLTSAVANAQATTSDAASYIPATKVPAIARAVNGSCDAQDGVKDGILDDPRKCRFDPVSLLCKDGDTAECLTAPQVTTLRKLYDGARDAAGKRIFPGFLPGAEEGEGGWATWITGRAPGSALLFAFGNGFFANMVYAKPDWDYKTADLDAALKAAEEKYTGILNATDPNLKAFKDRGGKLVLYHGWADPGITALNTIDYYESVVAATGPSGPASFLRLYMAPGVQHCSGGPGPNSFGQAGSVRPSDPQHSLQLALEKWVEDGTGPSAVIATRYAGGPPSGGPEEAKATRPLCPYPQTAVYKGSGDTSDAASFACAPK